MAKMPRRYPLSTADGQAIPLDVVRPYSLLAIGTSATAGSTDNSVPAEIELMTVLSTTDAFIQFFTTATVAEALTANTEKPDALFLPAGLLIVVCPPTEKSHYSIRALVTAGTAYVQFLESWTGLTLQSQINRR